MSTPPPDGASPDLFAEPTVPTVVPTPPPVLPIPAAHEEPAAVTGTVAPGEGGWTQVRPRRSSAPAPTAASVSPPPAQTSGTPSVIFDPRAFSHLPASASEEVSDYEFGPPVAAVPAPAVPGVVTGTAAAQMPADPVCPPAALGPALALRSDHPVEAFWESWVHDVVAAAASWLPESTDLEAVVAAAEAVAVTRPSDPDRFLVEREWLRAAVPSTTLDSPSADLAVPIVVASDDDGCADMPGLVALPARPDAAPREALTEGTPHPQTGRDHIVVTQMPTPSPARPMHACAVDNVFSEEGRPTVPSATAIERFTANLLQGLETELVPPTLQIAITVIMIEELAGLFVFLLNRLPPRGAVSAADFRHFRDETHAVLGAAVLPRMRAHLGPSLADIVQFRTLREAALYFFVAAHDAQRLGPVFAFDLRDPMRSFGSIDPLLQMGWRPHLLRTYSTSTVPAAAPCHSYVRSGVPSSGPGSSTSTPDSMSHPVPPRVVGPTPYFGAPTPAPVVAARAQSGRPAHARYVKGASSPDRAPASAVLPAARPGLPAASIASVFPAPTPVPAGAATIDGGLAVSSPVWFLPLGPESGPRVPAVVLARPSLFGTIMYEIQAVGMSGTCCVEGRSLLPRLPVSSLTTVPAVDPGPRPPPHSVHVVPGPAAAAPVPLPVSDRLGASPTAYDVQRFFLALSIRNRDHGSRLEAFLQTVGPIVVADAITAFQLDSVDDLRDRVTWPALKAWFTQSVLPASAALVAVTLYHDCAIKKGEELGDFLDRYDGLTASAFPDLDERLPHTMVYIALRACLQPPAGKEYLIILDKYPEWASMALSSYRQLWVNAVEAARLKADLQAAVASAGRRVPTGTPAAAPAAARTPSAAPKGLAPFRPGAKSANKKFSSFYSVNATVADSDPSATCCAFCFSDADPGPHGHTTDQCQHLPAFRRNGGTWCDVHYARSHPTKLCSFMYDSVTRKKIGRVDRD